MDSPPLHALQSGVDGLNGLYKYNASSIFPNQSTKATNYWVDVVFNPSPTGGASSLGLPNSFNPSSPAGIFTDLSQTRVFPNPWHAGKSINNYVTFDQMSPNSTVKIFTVSAHWVRSLDAPTGTVTWDLKNDAGDAVASGYYVYLITTPGATKVRGTVAVIR